MFTLDQIQCFVTVAEELHFGRAAQRLQMTQPPLSRQIQKLEKAIGVTLLARDNRSVALTGAGEAFLTEAYQLLNLVEGAGDLARRVEAGTAGVVRLGFTAVSAISVLGPLLRRLAAELPDVEVLLHERVTGAQIEGIARGELDIGLGRPPFTTPGLRSSVVLREPLMAVVPADHRLARISRPLAPPDFEGERVIEYHPQQARYFHDLAARFLSSRPPSNDQRVHQILTATLLVEAERGLAFAPESAQSLGVDGVEFKPLVRGGGHPGVDSDPEHPVELHAIWRQSRLTPVMRRMLRIIEGI